MSETAELRIDLADGEWVQIEDFGAWTQRKFDTFRELIRRLSGGTQETGDDEQFIRLSVRAWHLTDPDTGAALNDPKTDDLKCLTVATTRQITERVTEVVYKATTPFPSLSRPSST